MEGRHTATNGKKVDVPITEHYSPLLDIVSENVKHSEGHRNSDGTFSSWEDDEKDIVLRKDEQTFPERPCRWCGKKYRGPKGNVSPTQDRKKTSRIMWGIHPETGSNDSFCCSEKCYRQFYKKEETRKGVKCAQCRRTFHQEDMDFFNGDPLCSTTCLERYAYERNIILEKPIA
jgi:hypothetical protein